MPTSGGVILIELELPFWSIVFSVIGLWLALTLPIGFGIYVVNRLRQERGADGGLSEADVIVLGVSVLMALACSSFWWTALF